MAAICLLPLRFPSEFIFDSDSAALMCTPVPLCVYTCTWFQVLVQVCTTCRHVSMAAILFFAFMLFSIPSIRSDLCMGGASREVVIRFPVPWALHIVIRVGFWSSKKWPLRKILVLIDLH